MLINTNKNNKQREEEEEEEEENEDIIISDLQIQNLVGKSNNHCYKEKIV